MSSSSSSTAWRIRLRLLVALSLSCSWSVAATTRQVRRSRHHRRRTQAAVDDETTNNNNNNGDEGAVLLPLEPCPYQPLPDDPFTADEIDVNDNNINNIIENKDCSSRILPNGMCLDEAGERYDLCSGVLELEWAGCLQIANLHPHAIGWQYMGMFKRGRCQILIDNRYSQSNVSGFCHDQIDYYYDDRHPGTGYPVSADGTFLAECYTCNAVV